MTEKTDELREIFLAVSDDETVTEHQREGASKAPVEAGDAEAAARVAESAREDGLEDAVEGLEASGLATG